MAMQDSGRDVESLPTKGNFDKLYNSKNYFNAEGIGQDYAPFSIIPNPQIGEEQVMLALVGRLSDANEKWIISSAQLGYNLEIGHYPTDISSGPDFTFTIRKNGALGLPNLGATPSVGVVGDICSVSGKLYICTNAAPTWTVVGTQT